MRAFGRWQVTLPGEEYVWEPDEVTLGECRTIEAEAGCTYMQWITRIGDADRANPLAATADQVSDACQVLIWFLRLKAGQQQERAAVDFPIRKLEIRQLTDDGEDDDPEASAGSEPATSPTSPESSVSDPGNGTP